MIRNERVCDLCTSAVPNESPHTDRFSTLTLVGSAQQAVQSAFGRAAGIDLCDGCTNSVVRVLTAGKTAHTIATASATPEAAKPAPAPAPAEHHP